MTRPNAELEALAARVEAEAPSRDLWLAAYLAAAPVADRPPKARDAHRGTFLRFHEYGAYLDAADMLRPKGWRVTITSSDAGHVSAIFNRVDDRRKEAYALGLVGPHAEARARLAATLRALAKEPGDG